MSHHKVKITPKPRESDKRILHQFCENTSLHGLKYIFEDGSLLFERLAWMLVFLSGICFSGYFCWQMWQKWDESPIITSVETQMYPLKNVPFPAITICSVNKVSKRRLMKALENPKFENVSYSKLQSTLRYMTKLDRAINNEKELDELNEFYQSHNISALDLFYILEETAPACSDLVMDCNWLGLPEPCMEYFSFIPTDDGMCCTFNGPKDFDPLLRMKSNINEPLRVNGNGYRMGLSLVVDADVHDYSVTNGKFDGFKILVHASNEFPDVADRGFVIGPGTESFVGVKGTTSFNTDMAEKVSPDKRQCLANGEKKLEYFQDYSRSACFIECATHLMRDRCQCRPYFFKGDSQTRLCEMKSYSCASQVYEEIRAQGDELCKCLPTCTDTWYEPEISYAPFPGNGFNMTRTFKRLVDKRNLSVDTDSNQYFRSNVAVLHVYYKQKTGMRYRTDIRFGIEDFISAMGGLLGLGLGMSFISVIELVYFLCFRRYFLRHRSRPPCSLDENVTLAEQYASTSRESKDLWPSSSTLTSSIATVSNPCLDDEQSKVTRRSFLKIPTQTKY